MSLRPLTPAARPLRQQSTAPGLSSYAQRFAQIMRQLDHLRASSEVLAEADAKLVEQVGRAKGRLELRGATEVFLEELQSDLNRRTVGSLERMLSAIAQDVLQDDIRIKLDLYTERGMSALDISVDAGQDRRTNIVQGTGGSLTNVICLGLRMIATVKSGMRKFVALDEPDCWTRPDRVPLFYNVIDSVADRLGLQSLVITHHNPHVLPQNFSIIRLLKSRDGRLTTETVRGQPDWREDQIGIRSIHLKNYMSHSDTRIDLTPGVTAIIGDNNFGKSVFTRALGAVAYGEIDDSHIAHSAKRLDAAIEIEGGRVIRLTRERGRNPVNEWTLEDLSGTLVTDESTNTQYKTGGRTAPDWVARVLGIARIDGLEPQITHQKFPIFLLGETAARRASVLSIGREGSYVQDMILIHRDGVKKDQATVKSGEAELAAIRQRAERISAAEAVTSEFPRLKDDIDRVGELERRIDRASRLLKAVEIATEGCRRAEHLLAGFADMPAEVPDLSPTFSRLDHMARLGLTIANMQKGFNAAKLTQSAITASIGQVSLPPDAELRLEAARGLAARLASIEQLSVAVSKADSSLATATEQMERVRGDLRSLLAEAGNVCPMCAGAIADENALIRAHSHE